MNEDAIELSVGALASVAEREGLGSLHLTLQPEPMWLPREDLAAARAAVDGELAAAGLLDGRGRLDPDFRDWLPVLTTAAIEYYGWVTHEGTPFSVLAASRGLLGVVAVRRGDRITLAPADHTVLPAELAARLPEVGPGGGTRWAVRVSDFEEGKQHTHRDRSVAAIVAEISKVVERETTGGGELYVAERDPAGRRRSLRRPLHYVDTDWGRYVNYRVSVGDEDEFRVQPADAATVAATLESLRGQLTTAQRV
ncbi:ESX secretion-associated protein EspG [Saccharomonospora piscinae]|uniref:ESX secretion-associated protein EspG n=1 Tax=Saccharomonospora piscinae TaxID=687388 RepID=UPI000464DF04|nr:ESX secretion-associated protein EspG [Saccharomonospora piscinae]